jgi:predicted DNA-binding protein (UPF0251 family)
VTTARVMSPAGTPRSRSAGHRLPARRTAHRRWHAYRGGDLEDIAHVDPELGLVEDREILLLRFYKGMIQTEIAGRIGVSQMQISRVLAATLARLRAAGKVARR